MKHHRTVWWLLVLPLAVALAAPGAGWAQQPNLTYYHPSDWTYPTVPTNGMHTPPGVQLSPILPGNTHNIYWSDMGINNGTASTVIRFSGENRVDGVAVWLYWAPIVPAGGIHAGIDEGPFTIKGGRHTLEIRHDTLFEIAESDESDNNWAHQFIFTPLLLADATPVVRSAPPDRFGGLASIVDGSLIDSNCDGFRFSSTGWWNVVTVRALDLTADYDCYLYSPSTGSEDGFTSYLGYSANLEGYLDAVVVNRNVADIQDWDVGVENYSGSSSFEIEKVVSSTLYSRDSTLVHFDADEYLKVWDTYIWPADAGWLTVAVDVVGNMGPVEVRLFDATFSYGGLENPLEMALSNDEGRVRLHHEFTGDRYYGVVVLRQPIDGGAALDISLELEPAKPDLQPAFQPGWAAPLVPRPLMDGTPGAVAAPDTLHGFTPDTYFNVAYENASPVAADPTWVFWYEDGMDYYVSILGPTTMQPFSTGSYNSTLARTVPGGRHTYTLHVDPDDDLEEIFEDNNVYGEQFCWSPLQLATSDLITQPYPPMWAGGWWSITSGELFYSNNDGYRMPLPWGYWEVVVLTQDAAFDYDIELHNPVVGTKDGFTNSLAGSYWLDGETDYVVVNHNVISGPVVIDVGVSAIEFGGPEYTLETVSSLILPVTDGGTFGPFLVPASRMLNMWDIWLEPDVYAFRLDNVAGPVDWGMNLHPADLPFQGRHNFVPDGHAWTNGPGQDEWFTVAIVDPGWYGLSVFKAVPDGFAQDGEYGLRVLRGLSDVPDDDRAPAATALVGAYPNPFNPQTTIAYDLAEAGRVDLAVYDLQGALVRRLVRASLPSGRHEVVWDGTDESGRRVATGVYMTRLQTRDHVGLQKVVVLK